VPRIEVKRTSSGSLAKGERKNPPARESKKRKGNSERAYWKKKEERGGEKKSRIACAKKKEIYCRGWKKKVERKDRAIEKAKEKRNKRGGSDEMEKEKGSRSWEREERQRGFNQRKKRKAISPCDAGEGKTSRGSTRNKRWRSFRAVAAKGGGEGEERGARKKGPKENSIPSLLKRDISH